MIREGVGQLVSDNLELRSGQSAIILSTDQILLSLQQIQQSVNTPAADHDASINSILAFREKNQQQVAVTLFEELKTKSWTQLSNRQKFRLTANLAMCKAELYQTEAAAPLYIEAGRYQPETIEGMLHMARGYMLQDKTTETDQYVKQVLEREPSNAEAYLLYILAHTKNSTAKELAETIPIEMRQVSRVAFALSEVANQQDNLHEAIKWASIAVENANDKQTDLKAHLANLILSDIHEPFAIATGQLTPYARAKAKYVIVLYDEAWNKVKSTDLRNSRSYWLVNRAEAKRMLDDKAGSLADMIEVCGIEPTVTNYRHLTLCYVGLTQYDKALEILNTLSGKAEGEALDDARLFEAEIYAMSGDDTKAKSLLENLITKLTEGLIQDQAYETLFKILIRNELFKEAINLCDKRIAIKPDWLMSYIFKAKVLRLKNNRRNKEKRNELLDKAIGLVNEQTKSDEIRQLANELGASKRYVDAAGWLEKITNTEASSLLTEELIFSYHKAGQTAKVVELSKRFIEYESPSYRIAELLAITYLQVMDYPNAIATCEKYLDTYPDDQRVWIRLATIYHTQNDWQKLKYALDKIGELDLSLPYTTQYQVCQFLYFCGDKEKCFLQAYETRKHYFGEQRAHELFAGLLLGFENPVPHARDPQRVTIGCAVTIEGNGRQKTYVIREPKVSSLGQDEIAANSQIAASLLGRKVGDHISLNPRKKQKGYKIVLIQHRYNYACRDTFRLLDREFMENNAFERFEIGKSGDVDEDFKPLFDKVLQAGEHQDRINELLATTPITLGAVAVANRSHPIKEMYRQVNLEATGILTTDDLPEFRAGFAALEKGTPILFDIISLFTLNDFELLNLLEHLPNKKAVSQSTLNEINVLVRELHFDKFGRLKLIPYKGQVVRHVISEEEIQSTRKSMDRLLSWIRRNCEVLPCTATHDIGLNKKKSLDKLIGLSFADTLLTAAEKDYMICSEEANLRGLAFGEYQLDGSSTFGVLTYLYYKKKIDIAYYHEKSLRLISLNYKYIPADSSLVTYALEKFRSVEHAVVVRAIDGMFSKLFPIEHSLRAVIALFYRLYNYPSLASIFGDSPEIPVTEFCKGILDRIVMTYQPKELVLAHLSDNVTLLQAYYPSGFQALQTLLVETFKNSNTIDGD